MAIYYILSRLAFAFFLLFVMGGVGTQIRRIFRLRVRFNLLEKVILDIALGAGVIGYVFWFVGLVNLYYSVVINILTGLFFLLALRGFADYRADIARFKKPWFKVSGWNWLLVAVLAYFVIFNLIGALGIEVKFDSLWYHLSEARVYLQEHGIHLYYPSIFGESASGPRLAEILYSWGMNFFPGASVPKLLHFFAGIGLLAGVVALSKRYFGLSVALLAGLFVYSTRIVAWLSHTAYIDLFTAFFLIVAFVLLFRFWQNPGRKLLLLTSVILGFALATKMQALMILPAVAALVFWRTRNFKLVATSLAPALVIVLPWYLENWLVGGSPFIPIANAVPGVEHLGGGRSIWEYAFAIHPKTFLKAMRDHLAQEFPLVSLGLLAFLAPFDKKSKRRLLWALAIFGLAGVFFWTYVPVHDDRYLLPFLPTLAVAGAVSMIYFGRQSKILALVLGVFVASVVGYQALAVFYLSQASFGVVFGKIDREQAKREAFAGNIWTYYPSDDTLKKLIGQGKAGTIIQHNFYVDFPWIDIMRFQKEVAKITGYQQLKDFFTSQGLSHLVFHIPYHLGTILDKTAIPNASQEEFKKIIKKVYDRNHMEAYSLAD